MHTAICDSCHRRKACRAGHHDGVQHRDLKLKLCRSRDHAGNGLVRVRERDAVRDGDVDQWPATRADAVAVRKQLGIPTNFSFQWLLRPDQVTSTGGQTFRDAADCGFKRLSLYNHTPPAIANPWMRRRRRQQLIRRKQECTLLGAKTRRGKRLRKHPLLPLHQRGT
ncbi:hypothetical protein SAMN05446635_9060 [Burkholderia sp. OK233]|nr:hypothetical protein SAMN05446635_9060 [Burkholderia sp. OK233]